jgi:transcriptional regulator with XRE-family HTH domain
MPATTENILRRIKFIRKSKRRSMHDCATILGLTREAYHHIESGLTPLTLPQLELLAIYLGVDPADIFNNLHHQPLSSFLNEDIRPKYISLRDKMVSAFLSAARQNQSLSLEDIAQATGIPLVALQAYDNGDEPIPLPDLLTLSECLEIPITSLLESDWKEKLDPEGLSAITDWHPEFIEGHQTPSPSDDPYQDLLSAIKMLPTQDQAKIAKTVLEHLRSR